MAGEGRLDGRFRRIAVADFAEYDHVRVLAHDIRQRGLEGDVDLGVERALRDALDHVFHRIFDRGDAAVDTVEIVDAAIEGRGFSGAGRAGDHDDAAGQIEHIVVEPAQGSGKHPDFIERHQLGAAQQAQDDLFTVDGDINGHPNIDLTAGLRIFEIDMAVLVVTAFGDIGFGHDLDAVDQGRRDFFVEGLIDRQHAVATKANPDLILHRFDVDVAGLGLHGVGQQGVDPFDDPDGFVGLDRGRQHRLAVALVAFQHFADGAFAGDQRHQFLAEQARRVIASARVEGVGEGDQHPVFLGADRDEVALQEPVGIAFFQQLAIHVAQFEGDLRKAQLIGQHVDQLVFLDEMVFQQDVAQFFSAAGFPLQGQGGAQILLPQITQLHQQRADAH